mmetsp:Transcript_78061/g.220728  ORF Transcript_78061/g.220728 Transcript_78061/m.220728 type:complete len:236 (-) Transcript_78061:384-1091(-)
MRLLGGRKGQGRRCRRCTTTGLGPLRLLVAVASWTVGLCLDPVWDDVAENDLQDQRGTRERQPDADDKDEVCWPHGQPVDEEGEKVAVADNHLDKGGQDRHPAGDEREKISEHASLDYAANQVQQSPQLRRRGGGGATGGAGLARPHQRASVHADGGAGVPRVQTESQNHQEQEQRASRPLGRSGWLALGGRALLGRRSSSYALATALPPIICVLLPLAALLLVGGPDQTVNVCC